MIRSGLARRPGDVPAPGPAGSTGLQAIDHAGSQEEAGHAPMLRSGRSLRLHRERLQMRVVKEADRRREG